MAQERTVERSRNCAKDSRPPGIPGELLLQWARFPRASEYIWIPTPKLPMLFVLAPCNDFVCIDAIETQHRSRQQQRAAECEAQVHLAQPPICVA